MEGDRRVKKSRRVAIICIVIAVIFAPALLILSNRPTADWSKGARKVRALTGHTSAVNSVAFCPTGQYIATGSSDQTAKLWRVSDGACVATISDFKGDVLEIAWSPDGRYLAGVNGRRWDGSGYVDASAYEAVIFEPAG
jgi:WD40 repeat protein